MWDLKGSRKLSSLHGFTGCITVSAFTGFRGGSRAAATSRMECFYPLTIIIKHSILDVAAVLDPPLGLGKAKAFRKMARNVEYVKIFGKLSKEWHLEEDMLEVLEVFVSSVCGYDGIDVNSLRY